MTPLELRLLYDYAVWANGRVLDAAEALPPAAWTEGQGQSFDTLQATMVHVLSSELLWLARWRGESPTGRAVGPGDAPTPAALRERWRPASQDFAGFLAALGPEDWQREVAYTTLDGRAAAYPLWQMYLQVINHGTHHRSEAASMLTALGRPPEGLDLIFFFRERQQAAQ